MSNLPLIDPAAAPVPVADLLAAVQRNLVVTPNMTRAMANSQALLGGYLALSEALSKGVLRPAVREQIALAQDNGCSYRLSAHSHLAEHAAHLGADDFEDVQAAGGTDEEIAETLGHVALNVLTNYVNNAAGVEIDFPVVAA